MMEKRIKHFEKMASLPYYDVLIKKLKKEGKEFCLKFISENGGLSPDDWAFKVHRLSLTMKPYNSVVEEALSCLGSATGNKIKRRRK